jgi:hypothetical protein
MPSRENFGQEVSVEQPRVFKMENRGFWNAGGELEEEWGVIRGLADL